MSDPYQINIDTFNDFAERYQQKYFELSQYNPTYDCFCENILVPNAQILELGCGPGNISNYLLKKRPDFKILATDAAPKMLALAQKNNPGLNTQLLDFRELNKLDTSYDGIVCGFGLPYLNKADAITFLNSCLQLLKPQGVLYLSTIEGDYKNSGEQTGTETGRSVFMFYHSESDLLQQMDSEKIKVLMLQRLPFPMPNGSVNTDLILIIKKV